MQTPPPLSLSLSTLALLAALAVPARAANDIWDNNPGGNWENGANWTDSSTPGNLDTATFNLALTYPVTFGVAPAAIQNLTVSAGTVTFASTGGAKTLFVNAAGGGNDLLMAGATSTVILGTTPNNAVNLTAGDDISISGGATLEARFGSAIVGNDFSSVGLNGTVRVDGAGSSLTLNSAGAQTIGNLTTGSLNFLNGSTGNTINGSLSLATAGTAGVSGTLSLNGGSSLTQNGASTITVGHATTGTAAINLGTTASGGTLTTGTGLLTINPTGTVAIGSAGNAGTLNANGDVLVNGGQLTRHTTGVFNLASGKTLTVQNAGDATFTGGLVFNSAPANITVTGAGSTLSTVFSGSGTLGFNAGSVANVSNGGVITSAADIFAGTSGSGTVTVDGAGSQLNAGTGTVVGTGNTGTITVQNNAAAAFKSLFISNTGSGGTGTVNVLSGADATALIVRIGESGTASTAKLTVDGAGSTFTVAGANTINVGGASSGTLEVKNGGSVTNGISTTSISSNGLLDINAGTFSTNGQLFINNGQLTCSPTGTLSLGTTGSLFIQNGGDAVFAGSYNHTAPGTVFIVHQGSSLTAGGNFGCNGGLVTVVTEGLLSAQVVEVGSVTDGALLASGPGSQVNTPASISFWGRLGANGTVTFENGATGTLGGIKAGMGGIDSTAQITVRSGADLTFTRGLELAADSTTGTAATLLLTGTGSTLTQTGNFVTTIGSTNSSTATCTISDGATFTTGTGAVTLNATATLNITDATIHLNGPLTDNGATVNFNSGAFNMVSNFTIGTGGLLGDGDLTLPPNKSFRTTAATTIAPFRTLTLDGGTFRTGSLTNNGILAFHSGTFAITGGGGFNIGTGALGSSVTLGAGAHLDVVATATVAAGASVTLDGGSFTADTLTNSGTVRADSGFVSTGLLFNSGRLFVRDLLDTSALFLNHAGGRLTLQDGTGLVSGAGVLSNSGLVTGDGAILKFLSNTTTGEVRAEAGRTLFFTGDAANSGQFNLLGGTLDFGGAVTNDATGFISGRGALYTGGLTSSGQLAFAGGNSDVRGDVTLQAGARVVTSGAGSITAFYDDVIHGGLEIFTGANASTVFYGAQTGGGSFTGSGTIYYIGDLRPGSSPAAITYAPQVIFAPSTSLTVEIGGITPGTEHDKLTFTHAATPQVSWGGTLAVEFINGFTPAAGHSFDLFDFDPARDAGAFAILTLPSLPAGLLWDTTQLYTTGVIRIVPEGQTFTQWATASGIPGALPGGDHDSDGYDNGTEFALGLFPLQPGTVEPAGGFFTYADGERLRLLFTRPLDRTGVNLKVQVSTDLMVWEDLAVSVNSAPFTGPGFVSENRAHPLSEPGLVEVRDTLTASTAPRRQIRVRIEIVP